MDYPYRQAASHVRDKIRSGELRPGQRIDVAQLSEDLGLNRATVTRGLKLLADEGIVVILRAFGTFVADGPRPSGRS